MGGPRPRVVLDTNVCLDLFVFADPRCTALRVDLDRERVEAVTDAACREEWLTVLGYPALALDEPARRRATAAFDACVRRVTGQAGPTPPLPRCVDPDDQKFLLLAAVAGARWLISRDRALLALAPRLRRDGRFAILTPQDWVVVTNAESEGDGRLDVRAGQPAESFG